MVTYQDSRDGTFGEAHELKHGDAGPGKQLAGLGTAGGAVQLHLHNPVLDGYLRHKRALQVIGQGTLLVCMLQVAGMLLTAQGDLHNSSPSIHTVQIQQLRTSNHTHNDTILQC